MIVGSVFGVRWAFQWKGRGGGGHLHGALKKLLKELYVYALMSKTFMVGDYPQESSFLCFVMIFVDATNFHFLREFIYPDDR